MQDPEGQETTAAAEAATIMFHMRSLLGWPETRLAQNTLIYNQNSLDYLET